MLKNIDLGKKISKKEFKAQHDELSAKLSSLQREARKLNIPIIIVFEGWSASGKGTQINMLLQALDPRGFEVYSTNPEMTSDEAMHPYLWRFWSKTPARGVITIFDRSWYMDCFKNPNSKKYAARCQQCMDFERELTDDGNLIIKFFLHISKKEQRKRLDELASNKDKSWRVNDADMEQNKKYSDNCANFSETIRLTDTPYAPWFIVESDNKEYAALKIMSTVIAKIQSQIELLRTPRPEADALDQLGEFRNRVLEGVDLSKTMTKEEYKATLPELQNRISRLHARMYRERIPLVCVFEGWDAAGKGGAIRRLTEKLDPRGYNVVPSSAPNDIEKSHNHLWRYWTKMPKAGHAAIFDRSWYGRVMVERIEGFCTTAEWQRAYREINDMERNLADAGAVICKFWLHIDPDEQEHRFIERRDNPQKSWKLTDEDWRNRDRWDDYVTAVDEMLVRTSTNYAPWTVVEANSKYYARIKVLKTVIAALEERMGK